MSTPGHFPGHSSAGRFRLGSSKEAIGVLPGSDCSLSAHLMLVVLDHSDPHGPQGARSSLIPTLTSVGRCPRRARIGRGPLARGLAWLGACPAINERCRNNSARGRSAGTRGIRFMAFPANSNPPLAAVASQPRVRHHEFVTNALVSDPLADSARVRRCRATIRLADAARRGRTRGRAPESVGCLIVVYWCCHCPYSDDLKSSTESTIDATMKSAQPLRRGKPAAPSDPSQITSWLDQLGARRHRPLAITMPPAPRTPLRSGLLCVLF